LSFKNGGEPLIRKNILSSVKMLGEILGISDIPLSTNAFMPKIIINAVNNKCHRCMSRCGVFSRAKMLRIIRQFQYSN
jgi:hypothetical protein